MATHKLLGDVIEAERKEIKQRREKSHLSQDNIKGSLVGLSLSGGANRSASFSLGFVQAMQKIGLWKYVDYLSTTSGGGYIGAYLTSAILKEKEPVTQTHQPFLELDSTKQNAQVKRFIYGGHYLLKPWRLANMYLMGLFFINLAILSGLLAVCAAVAFLWRSFDYESARLWARMLGVGGDLYAPFWPFFVFAIAWLVAWLVSLFQRGGEATGRIARYLLVAMFFSLLVGVALLIGNGDIGGWESYSSGDNVSFGGKVWGPIVALVLGGLLPFLSPKRLLQSGLNPRHDWERYTFKVATTALLVGLPMLLIGWLARENISGFNTDENRPLVAGDIDDWPSLTGMMADPVIANLVAKPWSEDVDTAKTQLENKPDVADNTSDRTTRRGSEEMAFTLALFSVSKEMRDAWAKQRNWSDDAKGLANSQTTPKLEAEASIGSKAISTIAPDGGSEKQNPSQTEKKVQKVTEDTKEKLDEVENQAAESFKKRLKDEAIVFPGPEGTTENFFQGLARPEAKRSKEQQEAVLKYTVAYLTYAAAKLRAKQHEFDMAESAFLETGRWKRPGVTGYLIRIFDIVNWRIRGGGNAEPYWTHAVALDEQKGRFALAFDEVLRYPSFTETYLAKRNVLPNSSSSKSVATGGNEDSARPFSENYTTAPSADLVNLLTRASLTDEHDWRPYQRHELARLLLEHEFPTVFRSRKEIRRVVSVHEDQITRATCFFWSLVVFLIAGMWVDVNSLSLHRYYRNRIAQAFIVPRNVKSPSVPLSDMVTTEYGGPYHLINASVGMIRRGVGEEEAFFAADADAADTDQRWVDSFLFSRLYCGSEVTNYVDTVAYEQFVQGYTHKVDLAEATAISGAALSPGHVQNWLLAFLMVALNLSLGQWIPNPNIGKPRGRPRVLPLLWSLWKKSSDRPYCFVSDGGHCENLGLVQLLKRRCKLIIAVDASCDPDYAFRDLGQAMRTARIHGGVRLVELEPDGDGNDVDLRLKPILHGPKDSGDDRDAQKHFVMARIRYCDASEGLLIYVKPCLTGDESADLMQYRNQSPEFPQEPTSDQLFDAAQVEAYRHLGFHTGMELQKLLPRELEVGELWNYPDVDTNLLREWLTGTRDGLDRLRGNTVIKNPVSASKEARDAARPIANQILKKMRQKFQSPADIKGTAFRDMLENDSAFAHVKPVTAVAALQCAVIDRQQRKPEDREFGVWLLRSIEEDDAVPTNTSETLEVLCEAARSIHPERVRLAAIAVLCIVGRGVEQREMVKESLSAYRDDVKASIRLAVRNAISNLTDSPTKPR